MARSKKNILQLKTGSRLIAAAACSLFSALLPAAASDLFIGAGNITARVDVTSFGDRKFDTVVRQQFDFSCGSAALATLLTHHYDRNVSETEAFEAMWEVGDQDRIRELGFSLLEMKRYLEETGLKADGFRLTLERIQEIGVPGIALIDVRGYKHFVVIKGVTDRYVLIGDPSAGVISKPRKRFEKQWDGTILFIRSDVVRGRANFNKVVDWDLAPGAPFDRATDTEPLQSVLLNQTRPSFSGFNINTPVGN